MADGHWAQKGILRFLLRILWSVGGASDASDGFPRVLARDIAPHLAGMAPGDLVLLGNNGILTHIAVYIGDGHIVHSMATARTMRGWLGSFRDALLRMLGQDQGPTGVIEEGLGDFFDRYERDSWVILRHDGVDEASAARGVAHLKTLVGKDYDYDFSRGDDEYYCTEIVDEFLKTALQADAELPDKEHRVPLLLDRRILEPIAVLGHPGTAVVDANEAARRTYPQIADLRTIEPGGG